MHTIRLPDGRIGTIIYVSPFGNGMLVDVGDGPYEVVKNEATIIQNRPGDGFIHRSQLGLAREGLVREDEGSV